MGLVSDFRILLRDTSTDESVREFSDDELIVIIGQALMEMNVRADVAYKITTLDAQVVDSPTAINQSVYNLTLQLAEIRQFTILGANAEGLMKFSTQDTLIDPNSANSIYATVVREKQRQFERGFKAMIGGDWGNWVGYTETNENEVQ